MKNQIKKKKNLKSPIPKAKGTEIIIEVREKNPDEDGKVFSFYVYTTSEALFLKSHFRVFKTWLKKATSRIKTERGKKNKELRLEKQDANLPESNQRVLTEEDIKRMVKSIKKPPLEKILNRHGTS